MKKVVVLIAVSLFFLGFAAANIQIGVTGGTVENGSVSREKSVTSPTAGQNGVVNSALQACLSQCPTGCASPDYRICASNGQSYCNRCAMECYGLTEADNSLCENNSKVCCSTTVVYPNAVPSYSILKKSECDDIGTNGEPIVGAHKEIVSNDFCKIPEPASVPFCGKSTLGSCKTNDDCIKGGCSGQVCQSKNEEPVVTTCEYTDCYNAGAYNANCLCIENRCRWNKAAILTNAQIKEITNVKNAITAVKPVKSDECPESCTCSGSAMKCTLANGREMTIMAGNSGNVIVQVKGENMTTKVVLYKSDDGKIYGTFKNNETKEVKMLPDQVKEKIREKLAKQIENENISLDDNGTYQYTGEKPSKLFFIFPVKIPVQAQIDATTGEIKSLKAGKWWAFLAKDESQPIVGGSCATVTPGYNDACCQSRGFDVWNSSSLQCEFSN